MSLKIASHRGGSLIYAENSLSAFKHSLTLPVDFIEFDVHPSKDGVVVVHHDCRVDRMTNGIGLINEKKWSELTQLTINYSGGERILRLEELCELYANSPIQFRIELKSDFVHQPYKNLPFLVLSVLEQYNIQNKTVITSFSLEVLQTVKKLAPTMSLIWLLDKSVKRSLGIAEIIRICKEYGITEIAVHNHWLNQNDKMLCKHNDIQYGAFATHNEYEIKTALEFGVSTFTTDRPDLAIELRDKFLINQSDLVADNCLR